MGDAHHPRGALKVAAVVALYWTISISMVFIMKHLLSGHYGNQDLTIFVTWYQSVSVVALVLLALIVSKLFNLNLNIPSLELETILHSDILSLSFSFVVSLAMNNLMLKHISVSFYQVARSLTLIFSVLLSAFMLRKSPSYIVLLSVIFVVSGFIVGVDQEEASGSVTLWGIIYGILASFSAALSGIYFKKGEQLVGGSALKVAYVNNFNSMIIMFPLVLSTNQLTRLFQSDIILDPSLWLLLTVSGILSLAIGWASALQINYTSPVTHQVSINAKSTAQTILAITWNNESKTSLWWFGNILVFFGIMMYTYSKITENDLKHSSKPLDIKNDSIHKQIL